MVLYQPTNGYSYNSDTHFLYNFIVENLKKYKNIKGEILDIGSGSGILGLLVAKDFEKIKLNQCEIQEMFQFFTKKNSETNKINSKLYEGSFSNIEFDKKFDICVSNPPFYHGGSVKSEEPSLSISRHNSALPLEKFAKKVTKTLSNRGYFIFCYDAKQLDNIAHALIENGLKIEDVLLVHVKEDKEASLVLIRARKSSKSLCKIHPPLFMYQNDMISPKVQAIYDKSQTKSLAWKI